MISLQKSSYLNFGAFLSFSETEFVDTPNFPPVPNSDEDKFITIDSEYLGRLDLIAFDAYGDAELWWVIALANGMDNVPAQVKIGAVLRIPSPSTVVSYLSKAEDGTII